MSWIDLPPYKSIFFQNPVDTLAELPADAPLGAVRLVIDEEELYWFDGAMWQGLSGSTITSVTDTSSIDLTITAGVLSADVEDSYIRGLISATAPIDYDDTTGDFSIEEADTSTDGYLSSTDWNTFNAKEPAIAAGTTADYWRGDKSFQLLNIAALQSVTNGSAPATGALNEILTASQASNTATGVGTTGAWGSATSLPLTAGRWAIIGVAGFHENSAVLTTAIECGISDSATGVGINEFDTTIAPFLLSSTSDALLTTPVYFAFISTTTTYYLNTRFYYTSGAPQHRGKLKAIRIG